MCWYEIALEPRPIFTHAGVCHGLAGYVHQERQALRQAEVFIVEKGTLYIEDSGRQCEARAGDVVFHCAGVHQRGYAPSPRGVTFVWVHFEGRVTVCGPDPKRAGRLRDEILHSQQSASAATRTLVVPHHDRPPLFPEILEMGYRLAERGPRLAVERASLLMLLLGRYSVSYFAGAPAPEADPLAKVVAKVKYWADKFADRPAGVRDVAASVGMNPDYLNRVFRRHTGLTISTYLRLRKLEAAKHLLATGSAAKEVAARTGFADLAHFSRRFKEYAGVTPSCYARSASDYARN